MKIAVNLTKALLLSLCFVVFSGVATAHPRETTFAIPQQNKVAILGQSAGQLPKQAVSTPSGCVNVSALNGSWKVSNCVGVYEYVVFAESNGDDETFDLGSGMWRLVGNSNYPYRYWACTQGAPIDTSTGVVPTYNSTSVDCR